MARYFLSDRSRGDVVAGSRSPCTSTVFRAGPASGARSARMASLRLAGRPVPCGAPGDGRPELPKLPCQRPTGDPLILDSLTIEGNSSFHAGLVGIRQRLCSSQEPAEAGFSGSFRIAYELANFEGELINVVTFD